MKNKDKIPRWLEFLMLLNSAYGHTWKAEYDKPQPQFTNKDGFRIEKRLPRRWWLHPSFDFSGVGLPIPYIWFAYWLITWGNCLYEDEVWFHIGKLCVPKMSIRFMPD